MSENTGNNTYLEITPTEHPDQSAFFRAFDWMSCARRTDKEIDQTHLCLIYIDRERAQIMASDGFRIHTLDLTELSNYVPTLKSLMSGGYTLGASPWSLRWETAKLLPLDTAFEKPRSSSGLEIDNSQTLIDPQFLIDALHGLEHTARIQTDGTSPIIIDGIIGKVAAQAIVMPMASTMPYNSPDFEQFQRL